MPQELHCVQCCECGTFQSQIVKKIPKFNCALCGTKQSVRQVYARSNRGKEVRQVVQRLNAERGCREDAANDAALEEPVLTAPANLQASAASQHDWSTYIAPKAEALAAVADDDRFVTSLPEQPQRKRQREAVDTRTGGEESDPAGVGSRRPDRQQGATGLRHDRGRSAAGQGWQSSTEAAFTGNAAHSAQAGPPHRLTQALPPTAAFCSCGSGKGFIHSSVPVDHSQPARSARPPAEAHMGQHMAATPRFGQQLQQMTCPVVKSNVMPAMAVRQDAAGAAVLAIAAGHWQQSANTPSSGVAIVSSMTRSDGATSTDTGMTTVNEARAAGWGSWLAAADVQEEPAAAVFASQADVTRQALAWLPPHPQQQQSAHQHAAMLVTTSD